MKNRSQRAIKKTESLFLEIISYPYVLAIGVAIVTGFLTTALMSYNPHDQSWFFYSTDPHPITNLAGSLGAEIAAFCFYMAGLGASTLVMIGLYFIWFFAKKSFWQQEWERMLAIILLLPIVCSLYAWYGVGGTAYMFSGGAIGEKIVGTMSGFVGFALVGLLLHLFFFIQVLIILRLSGIHLIIGFHRALLFLVAQRSYWFSPVVQMVRWFFIMIYKVMLMSMHGAEKLFSWIVESIFGFEKEDTQSWLMENELELLWQQQNQEVAVAATPSEEHHIDTNEWNNYEEVSVAPVYKKGTLFKLPSVSCFSVSEKESKSAQLVDTKKIAATLEEKLSRFGVSGTVVDIKQGPVVTLFEYQPAIDTKLSKIIPLEQDLALALEAMSVRILAPIPGTSRVGFEVSNKERSSVRMGDIIRSQAYQKTKMTLPLILGQDTAGRDVIVDMVDMPHLLIAGSTGSGKSIALNTMLMSLLCKLTPDELKLIIVDPKRLEFASYKDIPHLLFPIITDPHRAAPVIRWLVTVMEERYQTMAEQGVRSISEYKKQALQQGTVDALPYLILMIDELADLMMVAGKESEEAIARLAQMARAAGIHLIVATQRPSVDVITGLIKVNFPSRISFRLTSKIDSRTILDTSGAECLLGKGDMLFMDAHSARIQRVHGAYVSDSEIRTVVSFLKEQGQPEYVSLQDVLSEYQLKAGQVEEPLLPEVLSFLQTTQEVSISLLQRRFKIGYNRSARLIEILEMQGKVMPSDGAKMRKVIK